MSYESHLFGCSEKSLLEIDSLKESNRPVLAPLEEAARDTPKNRRTLDGMLKPIQSRILQRRRASVWDYKPEVPSAKSTLGFVQLETCSFILFCDILTYLIMFAVYVFISHTLIYVYNIIVYPIYRTWTFEHQSKSEVRFMMVYFHVPGHPSIATVWPLDCKTASSKSQNRCSIYWPAQKCGSNMAAAFRSVRLFTWANI